MNLKKIKSILAKFSDVMEEDIPNSDEFLVVIGNMLRQFSVQYIEIDDSLKGLNIDDANKVSLAFNKNPDNPALALLMQSHVILKLSESFKND